MFGLNDVTRRRAVTVASLSAAALTVLAAACGEAPTSPRATPGSNVSGTVVSTLTSTISTVTTSVTGLLWTKSVTQASASAVIGPKGGSVSIPNGVRLIVPQGAVSTNVTFTVTRLPGTIVAYDFQPHGTVFSQPLTIQQPTLGTNLFKLDPTKTAIAGAYFQSTSLLDQLLGTASVSELEPTFVSADKAWITFTVKHFSGYMIATGRTADPE